MLKLGQWHNNIHYPQDDSQSAGDVICQGFGRISFGSAELQDVQSYVYCFSKQGGACKDKNDNAAY